MNSTALYGQNLELCVQNMKGLSGLHSSFEQKMTFMAYFVYYNATQLG